MIDSIIDSLKDQVSDSIKGQANVDDSKMDDVMDVIKNVAGQQVAKQMVGGGLDSVMNLFSKNENSSAANSLQSDLSSGIAGGLMEKLGISSSQASQIAAIALPALLKLITDKNSETPDNDPSPLENIFGGKGGGLDDLAGKALGGLFG